MVDYIWEVRMQYQPTLFEEHASEPLAARLRPRDLFAAAGFIAFVVVHSEIMVQVYGFTEGEVVTEIIDASVILYILPGFSFPWWYYAVYYVCAVSILAGAGVAVYKLNARLYAQKEPC